MDAIRDGNSDINSEENVKQVVTDYVRGWYDNKDKDGKDTLTYDQKHLIFKEQSKLDDSGTPFTHGAVKIGKEKTYHFAVNFRGGSPRIDME